MKTHAHVSLRDREVFRLHPVIRIVVGACISLWLVILLILIVNPEQIPVKTYISTIFFILLFTGVRVFYNGMSIVADSNGVTYRGMISFRSYPYESILKINMRPGLTGIMSYDVVTRKGMLYFSSFIADHKRLAEIIVSRSRLHAWKSFSGT